MKLWYENLRIYYISETMQSRRQNHRSWRQVNRRYPCKKSENIGRTIESKIGGGSIMNGSNVDQKREETTTEAISKVEKDINSFSMNTKQHKPKDVFPPLIAGLQLLPSHYILLVTTIFFFLFVLSNLLFFPLSTKDICCLG